MSLEQAIVDNTAAIHALIAALSNPSAAAIPTGGTIAQAQVADNGASSTAEVSSVAKPEAAAKKPAKSSTQAEAEQPAAQAGSVTKAMATEALKALAVSKGRDPVVAILAKFKAANLNEVKESDYAALVAACEAA